MKAVFFVRLVLGLLLAAFVSATSAAAAEPAPVPYRRTAHFSKRYNPAVQPEHLAQPMRVIRLEYPKQWGKWGQPAYAKVEFLVEATGATSEVQCVEATDRAFARAAEKCIERWYFVPALKDQQGICSKGMLRLEFVPPSAGTEPAARSGPPAAAATPPASAHP